jgi:hypothetical protein
MRAEKVDNHAHVASDSTAGTDTSGEAECKFFLKITVGTGKTGGM